MRILLTPIAALAIALAVPAAAQDSAASYPNRTVRIIVPFPAGGPTDTTARLVAQKLSEAWGQGVVAENRPGAGGNIGQDLVAKAAPDGYTLLLSSFGPLVISPFVYSKLPYDPAKDIVPLTLAAANWFFIAVHPAVPVNNLKELIALAKAKPGSLSYGSSGNATPAHLGGAVFQSLAGIELLHVPYKGANESIPAVLRGEVQLVVESPPLIVPQAKDGKLKVVAAARKDRSPLLPEVPTIAEAGLPGAEVGSWYGFHATAGTPKPILDKISAEMIRALKSPDVSARLAAIGADVIASTPAEYDVFIAAELKKWGDVIKGTGVKVE